VFADLELDEDTHEVARGGRPIELTATEFRLLRYLMLNPRRVLTRAQLLDHVWNYDFGGDARVLETYISYLRKKVDVDGPGADPHRARRRLRAAAAAGLSAARVAARARVSAERSGWSCSPHVWRAPQQQPPANRRADRNRLQLLLPAELTGPVPDHGEQSDVSPGLHGGGGRRS
jgi:hypothetical protein